MKVWAAARPTSETVSTGSFALQGGESSGCMEGTTPAFLLGGQGVSVSGKLSVSLFILPVKHEQTPPALRGGLWPSAASSSV